MLEESLFHAGDFYEVPVIYACTDGSFLPLAGIPKTHQLS